MLQGSGSAPVMVHAGSDRALILIMILIMILICAGPSEAWPGNWHGLGRSEPEDAGAGAGGGPGAALPDVESSALPDAVRQGCGLEGVASKKDASDAACDPRR